MTRTSAGLSVATAVAVGLVATLGAQSPNAPNPTSSASQPATAQVAASSTSTSEVKATGCLAKDASGSFLLNSAMVEPPTPAPTATSGTAGAVAGASAIPSAIKNATSFKLQGTGLDSYVDQKVEVNGMASVATAAASSAGTAAGSSSATGAAGTTSASAANLTVKSVKMVSANCS